MPQADKSLSPHCWFAVRLSAVLWGNLLNISVFENVSHHSGWGMKIGFTLSFVLNKQCLFTLILFLSNNKLISPCSRSNASLSLCYFIRWLCIKRVITTDTMHWVHTVPDNELCFYMPSCLIFVETVQDDYFCIHFRDEEIWDWRTFLCIYTARKGQSRTSNTKIIFL